MAARFFQEAEMFEWLKSLPKTSAVRHYCANVMRATDAPLAYHVGLAFAVLSATAPNTLRIHFAGSSLSPTIWVLLVGDSAQDRKTTAIRKALEVIHAVTPERLVETPGSREGAIDSFAAQETCTIAYPEFGDFLQSSSVGYLANMRSFYTSAFDGTITGRRLADKRDGKGKKTASSSVALNPRLTLIGGCAAEWLEKFTGPVDWKGGFMSRFWQVWAHRERDNPRGQSDLDPGRWVAVQQMFRERAEVEPGEYLGFDEAADTLWCEWYVDVTNRFSRDKIHSSASSVAGRIPTQALKLACLLSLDYGAAATGLPWRITRDVLLPAISLTEHLLAAAVHATEAMAQSGYARLQRTVYEALSAEDRSFGDVLANIRPALGPRAAKEILEALVLTRNAGSTIRNGTQVWWSRELRRAARAAAQAAESDGTGEG